MLCTTVGGIRRVGWGGGGGGGEKKGSNPNAVNYEDS